MLRTPSVRTPGGGDALVTGPHWGRWLVYAGRDQTYTAPRLLRLDPFNVSGRQAWVGFLLREGKKAEAARAFDVIRRLRPPDLAQREAWFRQQLR